MEPPLYSL